MKSNGALVLLISAGLALYPMAQPAKGSAAARSWSVHAGSGQVQIGYGSGRAFPQYAALQLSSGFFRMIPNARSNWGASASLLPALWSQSACAGYCQGAQVTASWRMAGADLVLSVRGRIAGLQVTAVVVLAPPAGGSITAHVRVRVSGSAALDVRPGEAFKPVLVSGAETEVRDAFTRTSAYALPADGWIIQPPVSGSDFGLQGQGRAPTIEVVMDRGLQLTGWSAGGTASIWCASASVVRSWSYSLTAEPGSAL